jgi:hypothetical protein
MNVFDIDSSLAGRSRYGTEGILGAASVFYLYRTIVLF